MYANTGPNSVPGRMSCFGAFQPTGDARGADDLTINVDKGDFVGDVPHCQTIGLADQLDAVHDSRPGQHILVIQAKLIGQKSRREVVVRLSKKVYRASTWLALAAIQSIVDQKSPIDPAIAAFAILDPDQDIFQAVEKRGQLHPIRVLFHEADPACHGDGSFSGERRSMSRHVSLCATHVLLAGSQLPGIDPRCALRLYGVWREIGNFSI